MGEREWYIEGCDGMTQTQGIPSVLQHTHHPLLHNSEMKHAQNPPPNAVIYSTAIDAAARAHDARTAVALLHEMQHSQGLPPNAISYSAAIHACAKAREGTRALGLLREMERKGLPLDDVVYATAIQALNLSEEDDGALLGLYDEMQVRGQKERGRTWGDG